MIFFFSIFIWPEFHNFYNLFWILELVFFVNAKKIYVTLKEKNEKEDILYINNLILSKSFQNQDKLFFVDKYINEVQQLMILHEFFKLKQLPRYISIDFNYMRIDGSSILNNKSIKSLFDFDNSLIISIYNAIFIHQNKPIFIFKSRSYINIINCTIIDSKFNFIPELFVISSSQANFINLKLQNVIFNKSSLITSFHSITEMNNISIFSSCFLDCSLVNNVDGSFLFNKFEVINCTGKATNIFDSNGKVYFTANNFISYNLSFSNCLSSPSLIFHSDFSLELYINNMSIEFNNNIGIFNGICKKLDLNNCHILNSFYMNNYIIKAVKSGSISVKNTNIRNCVVKSIININNCFAFSLINSTINNITNYNDKSLNNSSKEAFSLFEISYISSKVFVNSSSFLNIFNYNISIFSIHNSCAFFSNEFFKNDNKNYSYCCIETDAKSNLFVVDSYFPHSVTDKNINYFPIYAEGSFFVQNASLVSKKRGFSLDFKEIILNNEKKYWKQLIFVFLFVFQVVLLGVLILHILHNNQKNIQYEYLLIA